MNREPWGYSVCISVSQPTGELLLWAYSARREELPRDLRVLSRRLLLPHALDNVDFSESSLWALIIHAGGVSSPRGQLFWNTVLFSPLAPRNDLCDNSRKHRSAACQRCSITTEIQPSHKDLPHDSLCWQPASAQVRNFWSNSPLLSWAPLWSEATSLILFSRAEMKNRLNVSF